MLKPACYGGSRWFIKARIGECYKVLPPIAALVTVYQITDATFAANELG
jgi:hypothetical protein